MNEISEVKINRKKYVGKLKNVPFNKIERRRNRDTEHLWHTNEIIKAMERKKSVEPIHVIKIGSNKYLILDGNYRYSAMIAYGMQPQDMVPVYVYNIPSDDITTQLLIGTSLNARHEGLPPDDKDKVYLLTLLYKETGDDLESKCGEFLVDKFGWDNHELKNVLERIAGSNGGREVTKSKSPLPHIHKSTNKTPSLRVGYLKKAIGEVRAFMNSNNKKNLTAEERRIMTDLLVSLSVFLEMKVMA